ncbi:unnamed protein product [Parajaminaea phylloscopi]
MGADHGETHRSGQSCVGHSAVGAIPEHWPGDVQYLRSTCVPSPRLPSSLAAVFCRELPRDSVYHADRLRALDWVVIKPIRDPRHPAAGQNGLFAKRDIPARTVVVPYLGEVHTEEESDERSDYDLGVFGPAEAGGGEANGSSSGVPLGIDATRAGCEARFVNDYRGVADRANVFFVEFEVPDGAGQAHRGLAFQTGAKVVKAGQELLTSYGKGFWAARTPQEPALEPSLKGAAAALDATSQTSAPAGQTLVQSMLDRQRARLGRLKHVNEQASPSE